MFKNTKKNDEAFVESMRGLLEQQPARDPAAVEEGKARFLTQARMIQKSPVTNPLPLRHSKWNLSHLKEAKMGTIITLIVILGLALGGTSAVFAAQDDLPGDPLYHVKLLSEGVRLDLTADVEKKMDLDLVFAQRRMEEIQELIDAGLVPPEMSYARLENQLMRVIGQAALLDEKEVPGALLRIRQTIQERLRDTQAGLEDPLQTRLRTLLQTRLGWLDEGVTDPERFTHEFKNGWEPTPTVEPGTTTTPDSMQGPGYQTPGPGYKTPGPGYQTPEPGYQSPGPGYMTPGPGYQATEPGFENVEPGGQTPGEGDGNGNGGGNSGNKP